MIFFFPSRHNLLEKQKKLYEARLQHDFGDVKKEFDAVKIKTELQDELVPEEVFIDCASFVSNDPEQRSSKKISRTSYKKTTKRKNPELDDDDQQVLFEEIKALLKSTKGMRIQCPKCLKSLHRHSLKEHFFSVHLRQSKFKCDICSQEFPRHNRLLLHLKNQHEMEVDAKITIKPKTQCTQCGSMVRNQRRHILKVHLHIKNFFCDSCSYGAFFKYDLGEYP